MGQIVLRNQDYTYCNLQAIQAGGSQANTVLALGEVWIVDSTNASKTNGSGKYDKYIVGDGSTAAKNLTIHNIDDSSSLDIWVEDYSKQYFTTVALESGVITFTAYSWADTTYFTSISYSKNGGEWATFTNSDNRQTDEIINVSVVAGDEIRWKGIADHIGDDGDNGCTFASTCRFDVQGNIMSLLYDEDFIGQTALEYSYSFTYLFNDGMNNGRSCYVIDASKLILPATTLTEQCYYGLFWHCSDLVAAPELHATTLAESCYPYMFSGCTSLTTAPKLPATTLAKGCYSYMFEDCTSLTTVPELPATTLAAYCYNGMFCGCTNLTTAHELPALTLANGCYAYMFRNCTSLTVAPKLPAVTLVSSGLDPENGCYNGMFNGCTSLNYIKALFTTDPIPNPTTKLYTAGWVADVAASGIFVKADNATWNLVGTSGIPEGWNVYTESEYEVVRHYELDESELAISAALNDLNSRTSLTEITWAELKELRDNSNLVPGKQYRIIDYVATIDNYAETNARSANHQFDIIVTADSVNKLNEQARAIQHVGDAYFANSNLEAWELKYQLDNVKWSKKIGTYLFNKDNNYTFFAIGTIELGGHTYQLLQGLGTYVEDWSDYALMDSLEEGETIYCYYGDPEEFDPQSPEEVGTASSVDTVTNEGKGTILWMKDEWGNECPYDFKNIQFKRWKATDAQSGRSGLNNLYIVANPDVPAKNLSVSNTEDYIWAYTFSSDNSGGDQTDFSSGGHNVHDNVFKPYGDLLPNNVMFGGDNYGNSFGLNCYYNSWGNYCYYNSWGNDCDNNSWGNGCNGNSWGNNCYSNSWGNSCSRNSWGNGCSSNSWGNSCQNNSWGNNCYSNSWGNNCYYNSWGNSCHDNSWGNSCFNNSWGNFCQDNSWGKNCYSNSWGNDCNNNSCGDEVTYSTVFDGVQYTQITTTKVKFVQVLNGVQGTSSSKLTLTFAANKTYTQVACLTSAGALKIYVPGDLS